MRMTRRSFLLIGLGWFPFFRRRFVTLDGIRFQVIRHGHSFRRYLLIHGNEETARELLMAHMKKRAGIAYLVTGHDRYVPFEGGRFDPNRIFSRAGAERNLRLLNPDWPPARLESALAQLDRGRANLVHALLPPDSGLLVALHNNSEGYSVLDEVPASNRVSLNDLPHPHEFFLCTDPADFALLTKSPYNVAFQDRPAGEDDGSLSRLAAQRGVRYVNLEVGRGNLRKQTEMLAWLEKNLR